MVRPSPLSSPAPNTPSLFNLAAIALMLVLAGLAAAYWLFAQARPEKAPPASTFAPPFSGTTINGIAINMPTAWLTRTPGKSGINTQSLDANLLISFDNENDPQRVGVHVSKADQAESSTVLLDTVYIHQFTPRQIDTVPGLVGKPLKGEEGYQDETVWFDPISTSPFVAKCTSRPATPDFPDCIHTIATGNGLAITYQFNRHLLTRWRTFDHVLQQLLKNTGLFPPGTT